MRGERHAAVVDGGRHVHQGRETTQSAGARASGETSGGGRWRQRRSVCLLLHQGSTRAAVPTAGTVHGGVCLVQAGGRVRAAGRAAAGVMRAGECAPVHARRRRGVRHERRGCLGAAHGHRGYGASGGPRTFTRQWGRRKPQRTSSAAAGGRRTCGSTISARCSVSRLTQLAAWPRRPTWTSKRCAQVGSNRRAREASGPYAPALRRAVLFRALVAGRSGYGDGSRKRAGAAHPHGKRVQ